LEKAPDRVKRLSIDMPRERGGAMAQIDDVLAELRQHLRPSDSGVPKPVPQPVEAVAPLPACGVLRPVMTVDLDQRHGSAAVALRRLANPGRDGGVQEAPASEPINLGRDAGVAVEDDLSSQISQLIRRLSVDMPELLEEVVALIERRTAELDGRDAGAAGRTTIYLRFDTRVLASVDADAKRMGITRHRLAARRSRRAPGGSAMIPPSPDAALENWKVIAQEVIAFGAAFALSLAVSVAIAELPWKLI
jgi:hypothetical protein